MHGVRIHGRKSNVHAKVSFFFFVKSVTLSHARILTSNTPPIGTTLAGDNKNRAKTFK